MFANIGVIRLAVHSVKTKGGYTLNEVTMKKANEVQRLFAMSYGHALEKLYYILSCITGDQTDFATFAAKFTAQFITDFHALILAAQDAPQDNQIIDIQVQKTGAVNSMMETCISLIAKERYFLPLAFTDKAILNEFGANDYDASRSSHTEMLRFMGVLTSANVKYSVQLLAAGMTQAELDAVKNAYDNLLRANNEQEYYKGERVTLTQQRINKFNAAWEVLTDICTAGKIIYVDNYAKQRQYIIYKSSSSGSDIFTGVVGNDVTKEIADTEIPPSTNVLMKNTGTTNLRFCMRDDNNPCTGGVVLAAGEEKSKLASELGSGNNLYVTNESVISDGSYKVTLS
jgi:hypothetical protein